MMSGHGERRGSWDRGSGGGGHYGPGGGGHYGPGGGGGYGGGRSGGSRESYQHRGGRGGGRDFRGGGRGGRGQRGPPPPDLSGIKKVETNKIRANLQSNFQFSMYTVDVKDRNGKEIESKGHRGRLYNRAIFDTLLKKTENEKKTKEEKKEEKKRQEEIRRSSFFQGSYFFTLHPIQELEGEKVLPKLILEGGEDSGGDTFSVIKRYRFKKPKIMSESIHGVAGEQPLNKDGIKISFDCRCLGCAKGFGTVNSLLQHCKESGHMPAYEDGEDTAIEADPPTFLQYVNVVIERALQDGNLAKWGRVLIDPTSGHKPKGRDGSLLGAEIFKGYECVFELKKPAKNKDASPAVLLLSVDLKAKVLRTSSVLDEIYAGRGDPNSYTLSPAEQEGAKNYWIGKTIIYKLDKKTYTIQDLLFDQSADSLPVESKNMSHAEYFKDRKKYHLQYPNARPMITVLNPRNQKIFLPAEVACGDELDPHVRAQLPKIASFSPQERQQAVQDVFSKFLKPSNVDKTIAGIGLLAACSIELVPDRTDDTKAMTLKTTATVMSIPELICNGVPVKEEHRENWIRCLKPLKGTTYTAGDSPLNVVLLCNSNIRDWRPVYRQIVKQVDEFNTKFKLSDNPCKVINVRNQYPDVDAHSREVRKFLSEGPPADAFVLDFIKPAGNKDPDYCLIKEMLGHKGVLSQFLCFKKYDHERDRNNKSGTILQGLARQILQKAGARIWWVNIPKAIPLPCVMVGVDVYHAPREYDAAKGQRVRKNSCAAVVVQVIRSREGRVGDMVEIYSETQSQGPKEEFGLEDVLKRTVSNALTILDVSPASCIVWRDGISESSFDSHAQSEIASIKEGLRSKALAIAPQAHAANMPGIKADKSATTKKISDIPFAYVVCQKKIGTKFFALPIPDRPGKVFAAPPGTKVDAIQGLGYETFYIQGRAPPSSCPKPVRYTIVKNDNLGKKVPQLTWDMCHDYANWPGPIKVPSVCMSAHKLAMQAGSMSDSGDSINHRSFANKMHFL